MLAGLWCGPHLVALPRAWLPSQSRWLLAMAINAVAAAVLLQALTTSPQFVNTVEDVRLAVVAPYVQS